MTSLNAKLIQPYCFIYQSW